MNYYYRVRTKSYTVLFQSQMPTQWILMNWLSTLLIVSLLTVIADGQSAWKAIVALSAFSSWIENVIKSNYCNNIKFEYLAPELNLGWLNISIFLSNTISPDQETKLQDCFSLSFTCFELCVFISFLCILQYTKVWCAAVDFFLQSQPAGNWHMNTNVMWSDELCLCRADCGKMIDLFITTTYLSQSSSSSLLTGL